MNQSEFGRLLVGLATDAFHSTERKNAEATWRDLLKFVLVNQNSEISNQMVSDSKGMANMKGVLDSTAARANQHLSSSLFSTMTPPTAKWCKFRHKNKALNNSSAVSEYMDELVDALHHEFAESNFYMQIGRAFPFFTALGTMVILHEEKPITKDGRYAGARFTALHLGQCAWDEDADGIANTLYRKFEFSAAQCIDRFGEVPQHVRDMFETNDQGKVIIYHCIKPRNHYKPATGIATDKAFGSYYVDDATGFIYEETGYDEFPAYVVRFDTMPGEVIGRGLGHIALPDIKQLNAVIRMNNRSKALSIEPPMLLKANSVMSNGVDMRPAGQTVVNKIDDIKFFEYPGRVDVGNVAEEALRASINSTFLIDKLLLPPRTETGEMSAYEVSQRVEQTQRVLGSVPTRIIKELLTPVITRQVNMMNRRGALPPPPPELQGDDLDVDIVFVNQLARAQNIEEVTALQQWVQFLGGMAQLKPEVIDNLNGDEAARHAGRVLGVPEVTITDDKTMAEVRDQRAQVQAQQMEADLQLKQADAQSKVAK